MAAKDAQMEAKDAQMEVVKKDLQVRCKPAGAGERIMCTGPVALWCIAPPPSFCALIYPALTVHCVPGSPLSNCAAGSSPRLLDRDGQPECTGHARCDLVECERALESRHIILGVVGELGESGWGEEGWQMVSVCLLTTISSAVLVWGQHMHD